METPSTQKKSFKIILKSLDDSKMEFDLPRGTTVESFKHQIMQLTSIPLDRIRLIFKAKVLQNDAVVESFINEDNEVVHLIARITGNQSTSPQTANQSQQNNNQGNNPVQNQNQNQQTAQNQPNQIHTQVFHHPGLHNIHFHPVQNPINQQFGQPNVQMHTNISQLPINPLGGIQMPPPFLMNIFPQMGHNPMQLNPYSTPNPQTNNVNNQSDPSLGQNNQTPINQGQQQTPNPIVMNQFDGLFNNLSSILNSLGGNPAQNQPISINIQTQGLIRNPQGQNQAQNQPQNQNQAQNQAQNQPQNQVQGQNQAQNLPQGQNQAQNQAQNQVNPHIPIDQRPNQQNPQQPIQGSNPVFVNNNQSRTNVSTVNSQGITISIPSNIGTRQILLNTQNLRENEGIIRESNAIEIEIPRRNEQNNSATMLGSYLMTLHGHLERFLPNIKKCAKVLKNEQRLRNVEERQKATKLIKKVGKSFKILQKSFADNSFLEQFEFKHSVGSFGLEVERENNNQNESLNSEEDPVEIERLNEGRRYLNNFTNLIANGIPANTTLSQIAQSSGVVEEDLDLFGLTVGVLEIGESMQVLTENTFAPLDANVDKIKRKFQNLIINCGNNDQIVKDTLFKIEIEDLNKGVLKYGKNLLFEGFDPKEIIQDIIDDFYPRFKSAFLGEYNQTKLFSDTYGHLLKLYYGKIAYEISEGLEEGISSFHYIFKKMILDMFRKLLGFEAGGLEMMLEDKIWKHIFEGYKIHKNEAEENENRQNLMNKLKGEKDEEVLLEQNNGQNVLSEAYLKGRCLD